MTYRLHKQKQMNMTVKKTKFKILQRKKSGQKPQKTQTAKNPKNPQPPKIPKTPRQKFPRQKKSQQKFPQQQNKKLYKL